MYLEVSVKKQQVTLFKEGPESDVLWQSPCSTGLKGVGEEPNSLKTPRGRHHIDEKIGDGEPLGMAFKGRRPTGEIWSEGSLVDVEKKAEDMILTRILWLAGDEDHNQTTKGRYIYFHGTNREDLIGQPASHGCIRLKNSHMLELFELAEVGTVVDIVADESA